MDKILLERRETISSRVVEILIAIMVPPVAVLLNRGMCKEFFISVVLTLLGYFPGMIYTFYILLSDMTDDHIDS